MSLQSILFTSGRVSRERGYLPTHSPLSLQAFIAIAMADRTAAAAGAASTMEVEGEAVANSIMQEAVASMIASQEEEVWYLSAV